MTMELKDGLIIIATLLSPVIALQVSDLLNRRRQTREEQLRIFRTLMATRASNLDVYHVQALNTIDVVFNGKSAKQTAVRRHWKMYLNHLNDDNYPMEHWEEKRKELFVDLLDTMGQHLGFDFDKTHIKTQSYYPRGFGNLENEHSELRKGLIEILAGRRPLLTWMANLPNQEQ